MAWFGRKKRDDVVDLTNYRRPQKNVQFSQNSSDSKSSGDTEGLGFFGAIANTISSSSDDSNRDNDNLGSSVNVEERRRKLSKRLLEMTNKIEELSNQIYHLQQRIELLERKAGVSGF